MTSDRKLFRRALTTGLLLALLALPATAADLGNARLLIAGTGLTVSPESQTVPFDTPTTVDTQLVGFDPAQGSLPGDLRVLADFTGPEIDGILTLETTPGAPFRIPRLRLKGEYLLDNIRLQQGGELLTHAEPRSAAVLVTQVLVTRVTSRALTLDEIRSYGIVFDDDSFQAFNFTFAFAVDGGTDVYDYNVPILFHPDKGITEILPNVSGAPHRQRFSPPRMAPFTLQLEGESSTLLSGGCADVFGGCQSAPAVSIPGVILFPTDVSLLHQFFSVVLMATNGAPAGDSLVIRDLTARVSLPPGLRQAETEPPTPLGVPVPVRVPGPDGRLGTPDDLSFLVAQATGEAEVLVEGLSEGSHVVSFDLAGVLEGMPTGPQPIKGKAQGAVVVRDPTLSVTLTHPDVVRAQEEYPLLLTVSNTGTAPANLLTFTLPAAGLAGVEVVGTNSATVDSLVPGESEVVEFQMRSLLTGRVTAAAARAAGPIDPTFELTMGVGENDIPLSPTSIILPRATEALPGDLVKDALSLIGLGFSLATAPPSLLTDDMPLVTRQAVDDRIYQLAQAGRHQEIGEPLFDSAAILAADWAGNRDADWEWDRLRRTTEKGARIAEELGAIFAAEASASTAANAFQRFAETTGFMPVLQGALARGGGARLTVESRLTGDRLAGTPDDAGRVRELPFAELYDLVSAEMAILAVPEEEGYAVSLTIDGGGSAGLTLLVPPADGSLRQVIWDGVSLTASGVATVEMSADDTAFTLEVDSDGDGVVDASLPGTLNVLPAPPFEVVGALQNSRVDPTGHVVEVLFSGDVDPLSLLPAGPDRFQVPGKVSNGGATPLDSGIAATGGNPTERLRSSRIVQVVFNNPLSPYVSHTLTVSDVAGLGGGSLASQSLPLTTTVDTPGGLVSGRVLGADGGPVPFAQLELVEKDVCLRCIEELCRSHKTAAVTADANGAFLFDYVRQTPCSDVFEIKALDPSTGYHAKARSRMRFVGETVQVDIVMLGRGTVRGRVVYDDGSVPALPEVVAHNPVAGEGWRATLDDAGNYEIRQVPVGTITLSANDGLGAFAFQTIEMPQAGAVVSRDLVLPRVPTATTGEVRGTVVDEGGTALAEAYVALYVDGNLIGVERSGEDGSFDFGTVPTGLGEIEAYDGASGILGTHVFFDIETDQVAQLTLTLADDRGSVEGWVYRQTSAGTVPVEGAVVWAAGTPFNTVTDAAGHYELHGVFAGDRDIMAADLTTGEQVRARASVPPDGGVVFRDLYFVETAQGGIAGEVLDEMGIPVVGATIHLAADDRHWYHETFTDGEGRFVLPDLGPGRYWVHAMLGADGGAQRATVRFTGDVPFVTIQFEKGTVQGQVRADDGTGQLVGVPSVISYRTTVVRFGLVGLDLTTRTLQTAPDGTFQLTGVLGGEFVITADNPFYGSRTYRGSIDQNGQVVDLTLDFLPNGDVDGTVYDIDGVTPLAGAVVDLEHPAFTVAGVTTGADGRFAFPLVPPANDRFAVKVHYDDGILFRQARAWVSMTQPGQLIDLDIVMPRQGAVGGWVEDGGGGRIAGAVVTLSEHEYPNRRLSTTADSQGIFRFANIFEGEVNVAAQAPALGGLGGQTVVEVVGEGNETGAIVLLEDVGEITGTLLSPVDGLPVSGAELSLFVGNGLIERVTSDGDGRFRFRLLPLASYEVAGFDPFTGRAVRQDGLTLTAHGEVLDIELTLEARGEVDGHVYDPASLDAVGAATVRLETLDAATRLVTYSSSDSAGFFEFLGIPAGTFRLATQEPYGRRRATAEGEIVSEDQRVTVDLVLEESGTVTGSALNPPGVAAGLFPNVNVRIEQDDDIVGATLANPYSFDGIIAGRGFVLHAQEVGGPRRGLAVGELTSQGEVLNVDVEMAPLGTVRVTVVDSFGDPVPQADVTLRSLGFYGRRILSGSTGLGNEVQFTEIGVGNLTAWVTDPATGLRGSASGSLSLEGEVVTLAVQLQDTATITGTVLLPDGVTPAAEALVALDLIGGPDYVFSADENGLFSFPSVPLHNFTLTLQEHLGPGSLHLTGSLTSNGQLLDLGTLVLDDLDPYVVEVTPAGGSAGVPLTDAVTVRFSEPMDTTVHISQLVLFSENSGVVPRTHSWSEGDTLLTLVPNGPLESFTLHRISVYATIEDKSGRTMADHLVSHFTTADVVPPIVVDVQPASDAIEVPIAAQPRIFFSEPVELTSLSGTALQLTDLTTASGVTTTFTLLEGDREVIVTPVAGLVAEHHYRLTVQGVIDHSGNAMAAPFVTEWRTVDLTPPAVTPVAPAASASFTAGDPVGIEVDVSDWLGVASVTLELGGRGTTLSAPPWTATLPAPAGAATATITAEAVDPAGNVGSAQWSIQVATLSNAAAPAIALDRCLTDGDRVVPEAVQPLGFTATDDEGVASYSLTVDGVELIAALTDGTEVGASTAWSPPAGDAPGTTYLVEATATDFAGNSATASMTLVWATETLLQPTFPNLPEPLPLGLAGQDLALAGGIFVAPAGFAPASLVVLPGATVVPEDGQPLELTVSGTLRVQCGGLLHADGQGYAGAQGISGVGSLDMPGEAPPWAVASQPDAGGSHGGRGSVTAAKPGPAGEVYGSLYRPELGGGGGSLYVQSENRHGGHGGGIVSITAGEVVLGGTVSARGESKGENGSDTGGAGGGGSLLITAPVLRGGGLLDVSGGDSPDTGTRTGAGGGGRIALLVDDLSGFDIASGTRAWGGYQQLFGGAIGAYAAAGTVYSRDAAATFGSLRLDGGGTGPLSADGLDPALDPPLDWGASRLPTELPALGSGAVVATETAGADLWVTGGGIFRPRWLGAWMALLDAGGIDLGSFEVGAIDGAGRVLLLGAAAHEATAASYRGEYRFDQVTVAAGAGLAGPDPVIVPEARFEGDATVDALATDQLTVASGAVVRPATGSTLALTVSGTLTVEAGGRIDVTKRGYLGASDRPETGGAPPLVSGSEFGAGGSHGGLGSIYNGTVGPAGETYDSVYLPELAGGGGAVGGEVPDDLLDMGAGGGVLAIEAGAVVLDGDLVARGASPHDVGQTGGGGGGGTVFVDTVSLTGSGTIDVSGARSWWHGAGGGGRIALYADVLTGFDPATQLLMSGGLEHDSGMNPVDYGGPGSAFVLTAADVHGELFVAQDNSLALPVAASPLPALGSGTVGQATADVDDPADLWITPADPNATFSLGVAGMWVEVDGTQYRVIAQSPDRRSLLLEGASGAVLAGDLFRGVYKLDALRLRGGATVEIVDRWEIAVVDVDASSQLIALDQQPPVLSGLVPADGAVFIAGDTLTLSATATDDDAVTSVTFTLDGESFVDSAAPYEWVRAAPTVAATTAFTWTVDAVDPTGNVGSASRSLTVDVISDPVPPTVTLGACPRDGELVAPGVAISIPFSAADDLKIVRYALLVDGVEVSAVQVDQQAVDASLSWTPPAGAAPGQSFLVAIEVRDPGDNAVTDSLTLVAEPAALIGPQTLTSAVDGQALVLGAGVHTVTEPLSLASLTLLDGAVVQAAGPGQPLDLTAAGAVTVQCGGSIDVSAQGYAGETSSAYAEAPSWVSPAYLDAGGSHGGPGILGTKNGPVGPAYGSVYRPQLGGGGGTRFSFGAVRGGYGGGVLRLEAASLQLDGELAARGETRPDTDPSTGGGGGAIQVIAGSFAGGGSIDVSGADYLPRSGSKQWGAAGGGRVALDLGTLDAAFDPATQIAIGGGVRYIADGSPAGIAGPGTLYLITGAMTYGELIVDRGAAAMAIGLPSPAAVLPELADGSVQAYDLDGGDAWLTGDATFRPRWDGAWVTLLDATGAEQGTFQVATLDGTGRALLTGAAGVTGAASYRGEYRFDRVLLRNGGGIGFGDDQLAFDTFEVRGGTVEMAALTATDALIADGATVTTPVMQPLAWQVTGTLTVEAGASIDVTGKGYPGATSSGSLGQSPPNVSGSPNDAGGSHGGLGVPWTYPSKVPGDPFDSVYLPQLGGGGGGSRSSAPVTQGGGGVIDLDVGTLVLEGQLIARGDQQPPSSSSNGQAGGAGGTVMVQAGTVQGAGTVDVSGGSYSKGNSYKGGAGGGGRVALYAGALSGFDPAAQITAQGGDRVELDGSRAGIAGPGTIYVSGPASTYGDLTVHLGGVSGFTPPATYLPRLGNGTVGTTTVDELDPADLWVEPNDPTQLFDLGVTGMWLRVEGSDYRILDQTGDRRSLLLDGAAGLVAVGDGFEGVYKFDTVEVKGGAILDVYDRFEAASTSVESGSQLNLADLDPPQIVEVLPAEGAEVPNGQAIPFSAQVTDNVAVASVHFTFDGASSTDTTAPYEWSPTAPVVAGDYVLTVEATDTAGLVSTLSRTITVQPPPPVTASAMSFDVCTVVGVGVGRCMALPMPFSIAVALSASFEGVYTLDSVTIHGGAVPELPDIAEVGSWDIDDESSVVP